MATFPAVPVMPVTEEDLDYPLSDDDSSDGDIGVPDLDLGGSEDGSEDGSEGDGSDEFDDADNGDIIIGNSDIASLLNLRKTGPLFPTTGRTPVAPFPTRTPVQTPAPFPTRNPVQTPTPFPTQAPVLFPRQAQAPVIPTVLPGKNMTLQLAVMPGQTGPAIINRPVIPQAGTINPSPIMTLNPVPTAQPPMLQVPVQTKPQNATIIPQLAGLPITPNKSPAPLIPQLAGLAITPNKSPAPLIPQLAGLAITPTKPPTAPVLQGKPGLSTAEMEAIITNMQGINIAGITPPAAQTPADIESMLQKEADESPEDFEARRRLTLRLVSIPDYKLNNSTAVVSGLIMMKKSRLGITYDPDVEGAITYLTSLLQR
jgi:hypothetical protein